MRIHPQSEKPVHKATETGELEIDNQGRIWRLKKRGWDRWQKKTTLKKCLRVRAEAQNPQGYLQVFLMRDGVKYKASAHRLVWFHFNGEIPQGVTVNHKNGIKNDNRPENLELATMSQQRIHACRVLGAKHWDCKGSHHPKTKLKDEDVMEMRRRRANGDMVKDIAADYKMRPKAVSFIVTGRTWKHLPCSVGSTTG